MAKNFWLMKSEPDVYGWDDLVAQEEGTWDGVRNHTAARNLREMQRGDEAFFYHSNIGLEIVGIVKISQAHFPDPTDAQGKWAAVKVRPVKRLPAPVTLKEVKADPALAGMELVKYSRLSVARVTPEEWQHVLAMAKAKAKRAAKP